MQNRRIRLIQPVVGAEEEKLVCEVLRSGWLTEGPMAKKFEDLFKQFVGAKHAITATSCTTAIEMGLRVMGVGPGDEVIVPSFTHPATADAVLAFGAIPVLVDVDLSSYNMDFEEVKKAATKKTRVVMPVSWAGYPLDSKQMRELKDDHGLLTLEDAACSPGAEFDGVKTGAMADITAFSFHPRKSITTGEGGMITTESDQYTEILRSLKNFGVGRVGTESRFVRYGTNYKMSDILAAVGVAQMSKLSSIIERRIELAGYYDKLLAEVDDIKPPQKEKNIKHTYQTYAAYVEIEGIRNKLIADLKNMGIETQIGTYALHLEPYFANLKKQGDLNRSKLLYENLLALPMSHNMTRTDQEYV
ncbi:MAG: DegT/DnrJ/EryC1/StrS family aminotransferase [archaeon]